MCIFALNILVYAICTYQYMQSVHISICNLHNFCYAIDILCLIEISNTKSAHILQSAIRFFGMLVAFYTVNYILCRAVLCTMYWCATDAKQ